MSNRDEKIIVGHIKDLGEEINTTQKSDAGLQQIACLVAIFVPFETSAMLLKQQYRDQGIGLLQFSWQIVFAEERENDGLVPAYSQAWTHRIINDKGVFINIASCYRPLNSWPGEILTSCGMKIVARI